MVSKEINKLYHFYPANSTTINLAQEKLNKISKKGKAKQTGKAHKYIIG
jgi:hypothetical protein